MLRLLTDENFNHRIVRALTRRIPHLDCISVRSVEMAGSTDEAVLEYAASVARIVVTHDIETMPSYAIQRINSNWFFPGLIVVPAPLYIGRAIADLEVFIECGSEYELQNRIFYFPI